MFLMEGCFGGSRRPQVRGRSRAQPGRAHGWWGARSSTRSAGTSTALRGCTSVFTERHRSSRKGGPAERALCFRLSPSAPAWPRSAPARPAEGGRCRRPSRELIPPPRLPSPEQPGAARAGPRAEPEARGRARRWVRPPCLFLSFPSSPRAQPSRGLRGVGGRGVAGETFWRGSVCGHVEQARAGAGGRARRGAARGRRGWPRLVSGPGDRGRSGPGEALPGRGPAGISASPARTVTFR